MTDARRVSPPMDIDVRHSVRATLMAEAANSRTQNAAARHGLMDDLALLTQNLFMRMALGSCIALAVFSLWEGLDAVTGLGAVADLPGGLLFSSYINP